MSESNTGLTVEISRTETRGNLRKTIVYYVTFISLGLSIASLGPTLTGLAAHTGTRLSEISFLFIARSLGYMLGSFLAGRLYDSGRGHPYMALGLIGMAVMLALTPLISILVLLTAVLLLLGMAEAVLDVGANTLLVWVHRSKVGPFMNALHFFFGVGALISPIIVAQAVSISGDITWAYWGLALLMLPVVAALLSLPSPNAPKAAQDAAGKPVRAHPVLLGLMLLFFFLMVGSESGFSGWIYTYALATDVANVTTAAYLTSVFWGAFTLGRLVGIPIAARVQPRTILIADLVLSMVGIGVILLGSPSPAAVWTGTALFGLGNASLFPVTLTLAERQMPITGRVTSWFLVGASLGAMSWPWLIGQLFEPFGPVSMPAILLFSLLLALAALGALLGYAQRERLKTG